MSHFSSTDIEWVFESETEYRLKPFRGPEAPVVPVAVDAPRFAFCDAIPFRQLIELQRLYATLPKGVGECRLNSGR